MNTTMEPAAMSGLYEMPGPEEIELALEKEGVKPPRRALEAAITAYEKRRKFLQGELAEIAGTQAATPDHAEILAQQMAESRADLRETNLRLAELRHQLEGRN